MSEPRNRPSVCAVCDRSGFVGRTCPCYADAYRATPNADTGAFAPDYRPAIPVDELDTATLVRLAQLERDPVLDVAAELGITATDVAAERAHCGVAWCELGRDHAGSVHRPELTESELRLMDGNR
jgi:hypothetical protein